MELLLIVIIIVVIIECTNPKKSKSNNKNQKIKDDMDYSVYKSEYLLTRTEYGFFFKLKEKADKQNYIIFPKVRMEDFINVDVSDYQTRQKYRGYIKSRHVDFLICDSKLNILAAIELDDGTHDKKYAQQVDEMKNKIYKSVNIPIYRIPVNKTNYDNKIDEMIYELSFN